MEKVRGLRLEIWCREWNGSMVAQTMYLARSQRACSQRRHRLLHHHSYLCYIRHHVLQTPLMVCAGCRSRKEGKRCSIVSANNEDTLG
jgi:hypothetical protein